MSILHETKKYAAEQRDDAARVKVASLSEYRQIMERDLAGKPEEQDVARLSSLSNSLGLSEAQLQTDYRNLRKDREIEAELVGEDAARTAVEKAGLELETLKAKHQKALDAASEKYASALADHHRLINLKQIRTKLRAESTHVFTGRFREPESPAFVRRTFAPTANGQTFG